ncbi:MAG TPA: CpsD/CapB family tyrosine-protein kinase [Chthoniobacterales bacterium]|nr:CpsD/CapB family tyrosine-protein kinase [Chthoniobacterales bacterium]
MSRLYEALRRMEKEQRQPGEDVAPEPAESVQMLGSVLTESVEFEQAPPAKIEVTPSARLVALSEPKSLGAEKFRALVMRLESHRQQRELKCLQITSGVINEGKTLVAANLALTLAKHSGSKVLLVEGDLHRPALASLLGLSQLPGLSHWWTGQEPSIDRYLYRLDELPLWFLSAGTVCDQPSQILQSPRFTEAFTRLIGSFDWIVIDSTPLLPTVDANLWSRLVDGMLLVVREGVAPVKALKSGLASLDNPKLVGVVLNEASDFSHVNYDSQYYVQKNGNHAGGPGSDAVAWLKKRRRSGSQSRGVEQNDRT